MPIKKTCLLLLLLSLIFSSPALAQFDMQQIAVIQGARDSLQLGRVLAGVGDINKDGSEDLVIGQRARTFLYFGSKNFDTIPDLTFPFWTFHISNGDINGDSVSDLLLGTFGKIYVYYGSVSLDTMPDDSIVNSAQGFGTNFACGDINKDGFDDIAVYGGYTKIFVYLGGDTISKQPAYILQGPPNYFGTDGLAIGDINGDGYKDLAVSMSGHYPDDSTYIYFGGMELDTIPQLKL
ncbi:MAG TPA: VCBS repeat-containing protein, partial [Terriglobales bacterium]|nr:VCBS repeat-containing protein [Terriglobales bacterium]